MAAPYREIFLNPAFTEQDLHFSYGPTPSGYRCLWVNGYPACSLDHLPPDLFAKILRVSQQLEKQQQTSKGVDGRSRSGDP